ncbi:preprotein translocase subunit YajC [Nocardioides guangzhouensis]|uniref:preprotein translocase subunit YajC n=1 Tax=Nocardioides guangzhouensis TaxID=2497878 RepID=UPI001C377894|nr:preprotein translocase subunit YajC [Nocardioides guangzhouensis]
MSLLPILGIFLIFWLLVIRPASRRQRKLQAVQRALQVGDPVITGSGVFGTVRSIDDDKVRLEVAEGVVLTVARQSVVGVVEDEQREHQDPVADDTETPTTHEEQ